MLKQQARQVEAERLRARREEGARAEDVQRLAHEPTRMDPALGVTAYFEPDFAALTPLRAFKVPQQLRGPHLAVTAFQEGVSVSPERRYFVPPGTSRGW